MKLIMFVTIIFQQKYEKFVINIYGCKLVFILFIYLKLAEENRIRLIFFIDQIKKHK